MDLLDFFQNRRMGRDDERHGDISAKFAKLEKDHERLKLASMAMWELLKRTGDYDDDTLRLKIEQLDVSSGHRDGKASRPKGMKKCRSCPHQIPQSAIRCAYCGKPQKRTTHF